MQSSNETPATFVSESPGVLRTWLPLFPGVHNLFCKRVLAEKKYSSEHIFCNVCCGGSMCCSCALYLIKRLTNLLLVWHTAFQSPEFEAFSFILPCCACRGSKMKRAAYSQEMSVLRRPRSWGDGNALLTSQQGSSFEGFEVHAKRQAEGTRECGLSRAVNHLD